MAEQRGFTVNRGNGFGREWIRASALQPAEEKNDSSELKVQSTENKDVNKNLRKYEGGEKKRRNNKQLQTIKEPNSDSEMEESKGRTGTSGFVLSTRRGSCHSTLTSKKEKPELTEKEPLSPHPSENRGLEW